MIVHEGMAGTPASLLHCPSFHNWRPRFGLGAFFLRPHWGKAVPETLKEDARLREILTKTQVIALVGWSPKPERASHRVAAYLVRQGYRVIPVNPGQAGQQALGEVVRASLAEIQEPVDLVDIFRRSEEAGAVVDQALAELPGLKTVWMQLGVEDHAAAARAEAQGVQVVMNRCPAIEIPRLGL
jgi:uncharacterized protein